MSVEITDYIDVSTKLQTLGLSVGTKGLLLLPRNFDTASSVADLRRASEHATVRKLLEANGIPVEDVSKLPTPTIKNKDSSWIAPIFLFSASMLSANATVVSLSLNVLGNYLFEFMRGLKKSEVQLDFVIEEEPGRKYKKLSYHGPIDGLSELLSELRKLDK